MLKKTSLALIAWLAFVGFTQLTLPAHQEAEKTTSQIKLPEISVIEQKPVEIVVFPPPLKEQEKLQSNVEVQSSNETKPLPEIALELPNIANLADELTPALQPDKSAPQKPIQEPTQIIKDKNPKNCSANFHADLNLIGQNQYKKLDQTFKIAKQEKVSLPALLPLQANSAIKWRDAQEANRLTSLFKQHQGIDPALYTTSALGDSLNRSIVEIRFYLNQPFYSGICQGAKELVQFYKSRTKEIELRKANVNRAIETNNSLYETLRSNEPTENNEKVTLEQLNSRDNRALMVAKVQQNPNQSAKIINNLIILLEGQSRLNAVDFDLTKLFNEIEQAHQSDCICAEKN